MMMGDTRLARQPIDWGEIFWHLPLAELPGRPGGNPLWQCALDHPLPDEFWAEVDATADLPEVAAPVLHLSGWYDFLLLQYAARLRRSGAVESPPSRTTATRGGAPGSPDDLLVVHGAPCTGRRSPPADLPNLMDYAVHWFARWCADAPPPRTAEKPPCACTCWRKTRADLAPTRSRLPEVDIQDWDSDSDGHAKIPRRRRSPAERTARGRARRPASLDDPQYPAPTPAGATRAFPAAKLDAGPADQSAVEQRRDVLVYTTVPLRPRSP